MGRRMRGRTARLARRSGFTLIELLVAISIMALMAVLSWRGLSGMTQAQARLQQRADEVLTLQAGLSQWVIDLDELIQLPQTQALDWDGRALRLTRRSTAEEAVLVVAWSRRSGDVGGDVSGGAATGGGQWLRWQSPPLRTRGEIQTAWAAAAQWAQNPGDDLKRREVRIVPLSQWQVFYYRSDAWTNPLSSADSVSALANPTQAAGGAIAGQVATQLASIAAATGTAAGTPVPEGIRLVLTLPPGQAVSGVITRDWVRPTLGGGKS